MTVVQAARIFSNFNTHVYSFFYRVFLSFRTCLCDPERATLCFSGGPKHDRVHPTKRWIVIGLVAAVVIAVGVIILWQPKRGSLEWNKREYLSAAKCLAENRFMDRLCRFFGPARKLPAHKERENAARIEAHRKALAEGGGVIERQFALKYLTVDQAKVSMANALVSGPRVRNGRFWISKEGETIVATEPQQVIAHLSVSSVRNTIVVTAPAEVIANCEEHIRKADVP